MQQKFQKKKGKNCFLRTYSIRLFQFYLPSIYNNYLR